MSSPSRPILPISKFSLEIVSDVTVRGLRRNILVSRESIRFPDIYRRTITFRAK